MTTLSRSALGLPRARDCFGGELCLTDPVNQDLCVTSGDTGSFMIVVTEADMQTPIDVTAATWDADIRVRAEDMDTVGSFVVTLHPGYTHIVDVTLLPAISATLIGNYVYDVQMTLDGKVTTLVGGTLAVNQDVSR